MPETGFSLRRIKTHLRKWIGLYLAATIALCFLNHLIYTMTRPGYSDDELLKIMLLNADAPADCGALEEALLAEIQTSDGGIRAVEFEALPGVQADDPSGMMLLSVRLISGFGDVYLSDRTGFDALAGRAALLDLGDVQVDGCAAVSCVHPETGEEITGGLRMEESRFGSGIYLSVAVNGTDIESAKAALPLLAELIKE